MRPNKARFAAEPGMSDEVGEPLLLLNFGRDKSVLIVAKGFRQVAVKSA